MLYSICKQKKGVAATKQNNATNQKKGSSSISGTKVKSK
jgi:hypothetical protein